MDGIGGLVIGHMFRLPDNVMPKGYRGENGIGSQLGNAITSISHTLSDGDWVTKIDTLNIVLDNIKSEFNEIDLSDLLKEAIQNESGAIGGRGGYVVINDNTTKDFGKVDPSVPKYGAAILDLLSYTEGTAKAGQNGYDVIVGYKSISNWNENYTLGHPNQLVKLSDTLSSTAAGRYQFLSGVWKQYAGGNNIFNKKNQDITGYNLLIKKRNISPSLLELAYNTALNGVKDVDKNEAFLQLLGNGTQKLAGEWASIPDRTGKYQYSGQGHKGVGVQDVYNIYLKAVEKYK
jgi:muramidase (phage lysozyme)